MAKTEGGEQKRELRKLIPAHELARADFLAEAAKDRDEAVELEIKMRDIVKDFNKLPAKKRLLSKVDPTLKRKQLYGEFLKAYNRLGALKDRTDNIERISHEHKLAEVWPKVLALSNNIRAIVERQRVILPTLAEERKK